MNIRALILGGALAAVLSLPSQAAAILNAGFETGDLNDWSFTSGSVDVVTDADDALAGSAFSQHFEATEGDYFAKLTAGPVNDEYTLLFQSFTLSVASRVEFDAAFLAFDDVDHNDDAYVRVFSLSTNEIVFASSVLDVDSQGHTPWARFSTSQLAAGDYTFEAGVRNVDGAEDIYSSQLLVDNVAAVVPEPATWAMLLVGFGVIGGALRGHRRMTGYGAFSA